MSWIQFACACRTSLLVMALMPAGQVHAGNAAATDAGGTETSPAPHSHTWTADGGTAASAAPLALSEAVRLALTAQPKLRGDDASIAAAEHEAIAVAQLPDPKLSIGIRDLPFDTPSAFSFHDDNFTMVTVGISQDFTREDKRRLKGDRKNQEAGMARSGRDNDRRAIARDTALAWLDTYEAEQAVKLSQELASESDIQIQSLENQYRNGRSSQADWLAAKVEAGLVRDKQHEWQHHAELMRATLARWIGSDAERPLAADLNAPATPDSLPGLIDAASQHPVISALQKQIDMSQTDVAMARQAYKPDYSIEGYLGYRSQYADFVGVQVSFDLPYFTANRQDRGLSAALAESSAASDRKEDALRELHAQITQNYIDWHHNRERAEAFDKDIIPDARLRVEAAQSAYAAGRGTFEAILSARRSLLDTQLQHLALSMEAVRSQLRLQYFATQDASL